MLVPANDFKRQWNDIGPDALAACERAGRSGWYILGQEVEAFERELASLTGRREAVGCASGLDAIEIALRALGLRPGQRVLTTPLSAFATTLAILRAGGRPVFVDVDEGGLMDLDAAERCLRADANLRWLVPVHLYGHCMDLARLRDLRDRHGLTIVEDTAQAITASFGDTTATSVGQLSATSFYPTKNLGALGDGGAILGDDATLLSSCRALRDYGQTARYVHALEGMNSRLDELHAAIMRSAMLPRLANWTERRRAIATRYLASLSHPLVRPLAMPSGSKSVWHLFPVLVGEGRRDAFLEYARERGVQAAVHYPILIPDQEVLARSPERWQTLEPIPRARDLARAEVSLPIHPYLTEEEIEHVVSTVNGWQP